MAIKSKILLGAGIYLLSCAAAQAQLNVDVSLGQPAPAYYVGPSYIVPTPTYYDPHHRNHDFAYWRDRQAAQHRDVRERR